MPTYEFECQDCKSNFSMIMSMAEHEKGKVACPACKSKNVRQIISTFITKTSRKS